MTTRYEKLQEFAREIGCKLTRVHPEGLAMRATYYIHKPDGRISGGFDLDHVETLLKTELKRQSGGFSKHIDLMRNPFRD
jgi:hypothetical protein